MSCRKVLGMIDGFQHETSSFGQNSKVEIKNYATMHTWASCTLQRQIHSVKGILQSSLHFA